jgi:hypothetical protein
MMYPYMSSNIWSKQLHLFIFLCFSGLICINSSEGTLLYVVLYHKKEYFMYRVSDLCLWPRIISFIKMYLILGAQEIFDNNLEE